MERDPRSPRWARGEAAAELAERHQSAFRATLALLHRADVDQFQGASPITSFRRAHTSVERACNQSMNFEQRIHSLIRAEGDIITFALDVAEGERYHRSDKKEIERMLEWNSQTAKELGLRRAGAQFGSFQDEDGYLISVRPPKRSREPDSHAPMQPCGGSSS